MTRDRRLLAFFGLKYNPFLPNIPVEDLWLPPGSETFLFRVETLVLDGGFALVTGDPGLGKSKLLHVVATRLAAVEDVVVGVAERPSSTLGDFYRELGRLFGVHLAPANRYGAFVALRERWRSHVQQALFRPVLLLDEAQEANTFLLNELRLLCSERFDSEQLLTVVLAGDSRLVERFRTSDLLPLGTRIRTRMALQPLPKDDLARFLAHLLDKAGNPGLLASGLKTALVDHSAGNPRVLCTLANELVERALQSERHTIDEALFLEVFDRTPRKKART